MSGIRGVHTKPERIVRRALFAAGFRFRLHRRDLPGVPDVVLPGRRVAIFVHGCFWHLHTGCSYSKMPATRVKFWREKLSKNVERDRLAVAALRRANWRVLIVWECATREPDAIVRLSHALFAWINGREEVGEIEVNCV